MRTKLIVAENRRGMQELVLKINADHKKIVLTIAGNTGNDKILGGKKKFEKKNLFTCAYCRKVIRQLFE